MNICEITNTKDTQREAKQCDEDGGRNKEPFTPFQKPFRNCFGCFYVNNCPVFEMLVDMLFNLRTNERNQLRSE